MRLIIIVFIIVLITTLGIIWFELVFDRIQTKGFDLNLSAEAIQVYCLLLGLALLVLYIIVGLLTSSSTNFETNRKQKTICSVLVMVSLALVCFSFYSYMEAVMQGYNEFLPSTWDMPESIFSYYDFPKAETMMMFSGMGLAILIGLKMSLKSLTETTKEN